MIHKRHNYLFGKYLLNISIHNHYIIKIHTLLLLLYDRRNYLLLLRNCTLTTDQSDERGISKLHI